MIRDSLRGAHSANRARVLARNGPTLVSIVDERAFLSSVLEVPSIEIARSDSSWIARHYPRTWCERRDLTSHGFPHWILSPARLPIPPLSHEDYGVDRNEPRVWRHALESARRAGG